MPIVSLPSIAGLAAEVFKRVFSKPQLRHFTRYLTGLISCMNRTVQGINDAFLGHPDQSALNHFITDSPWDESELTRVKYEFLRRELKHRGLEGGILIIDDTISHHVGKHMEGAGWHYDASEGKAVWGHQLVTSHYVRQWLSVPLGFRIYLKQDRSEAGFKSKLDLAKELVQEAADNGAEFSCVACDTWYSSADFLGFVEGLGKDWVTQFKSNRIVISRDMRSLAEWAREIPARNFERITLKRKDGGRETYYACVRTIRLKHPWKRVRMVISYAEEDFAERKNPHFYGSNRLEWNARRILQTYDRRHEIDAFYKDAKQNLGLEEYELRKIGGIKRHLQMILVAHLLLSLGSRSRGAGRAIVCLETTGAACRRVLGEILQSFIRAVLELAKYVRDASKILRLLSSSKVQIKRMRGRIKALLGELEV